MNTRATHILLTAIATLLALHLLYITGLVPQAEAQVPAQVHEVLRAKLIELVSANGQVVEQLYPGEDGGGNLRLRNGSGTVRVKLGATPDGAGLILMDNRTEPAVQLSSSSAGTSLVLAQQGKEKRTLVP
jgi:hypothetical protein